MIRFYSSEIAESLTLPEEESKHCVKVLRHSEGDPIEIVDGKGHLYKCIITDANPKKVTIRIEETLKEENPWKGSLVVAIAPTKNIERMEWLVEKLTEIGVDIIIPMKCEHSERKILKTDRLEKKIISAMKQSLKTVKPKLSEISEFRDIISNYERFPQKFICYCDEILGKESLACQIKAAEDTIILIGPEGDFSKEEIKESIGKGYIPVSLGPCRLRTETAALVATDTFHIVNQQCN